MWVDDRELILNGNLINLDVFRDFLHFQIESLNDFIAQNVLLGLTLEELGIVINFDELGKQGDFTTVGQNPLLVKLEGNSDSNRFLEALVTVKKGRFASFENGQLVWEMQQAQLWVANIHQAMLRTHDIAHITQGSPGRMTEEDKMQSANTLASRRHLVVAPNMDTLAVWSNYWKGRTISGRFKEILRVFPKIISEFIFILLRVVRPIEVLFLAKHLTLASDRTKMISAYRSALWASMGTSLHANAMCASLSDFLALPGRDGEPVFNFKFNVRCYRQFATAVQRRHLPGSPKYTEQIAESLTAAGDLQAGRTEGTSHQNYAIQTSTVNMEPGFIAHYLAYSTAWHRFWGLETEQGAKGSAKMSRNKGQPEK